MWKRTIGKIAVGLLVLSLLVNVYLLFLLGLAYAGRKPLRTTVITPGDAKQVVAVFNISGLLEQEEARLVEEFCRQVKDQEEVKAVVLRVVSGGGGVSACDEIYTLLKDLKAGTGKKIVVSMGAAAASGGYYIAVPADRIVAEPTTVTGSIGVLAVCPVLKGTLEKIGVKMMIVRSSHARPWKAAPNIFEEPLDYQMKELQQVLDAMQDRFETVVRQERGEKLKVSTSQNTYVGPDSRPYTLEEVAPFNGRVYLAEDAKRIGLVDEVGYLEDALAAAARLAGLSRPKVVEYSKRKSLLEEIGFASGAGSVDLKALQEVQTPRIMMVWKVAE
jgi:protease-4